MFYGLLSLGLIAFNDVDCAFVVVVTVVNLCSQSRL